MTQDYLSQIPFRDAIRGRLTQLWNYPKEGIPAKHGDAWYYFYNDGLRNQSVLYRTTAPGAEGEVFLDPNTLSDDGTVALSSVAFSKGREILRLRGGRIRLGLGGDSCDEHRRPQVHDR